MRATSGQGAGDLDPLVPRGGVPRPPDSVDYVPYPETFGARTFRRLAETDEANV